MNDSQRELLLTGDKSGSYLSPLLFNLCMEVFFFGGPERKVSIGVKN